MVVVVVGGITVRTKPAKRRRERDRVPFVPSPGSSSAGRGEERQWEPGRTNGPRETAEREERLSPAICQVNRRAATRLFRGGTFRIKAHRAVKNYIFFGQSTLLFFFKLPVQTLFLVHISLASGLWLVQSQLSLLLRMTDVGGKTHCVNHCFCHL